MPGHDSDARWVVLERIAIIPESIPHWHRTPRPDTLAGFNPSMMPADLSILQLSLLALPCLSSEVGRGGPPRRLGRWAEEFPCGIAAGSIDGIVRRRFTAAVDEVRTSGLPLPLLHHRWLLQDKYHLWFNKTFGKAMKT